MLINYFYLQKDNLEETSVEMKGLSPAVKHRLGIYAKNEVTESLPAIDYVYTSLILFKFKASCKIFTTLFNIKKYIQFLQKKKL